MKIEVAILEERLFVFFVLVSNHYFTIVLFFGALQLTTHTSIKAAKVVTLKAFPSSTHFDPDLRRSYQLLYNLLLQITFRLLFSNPQAATTHADELSESHSEHKSIEGMKTFPCCSKRFISSNRWCPRIQHRQKH